MVDRNQWSTVDFSRNRLLLTGADNVAADKYTVVSLPFKEINQFDLVINEGKTFEISISLKSPAPTIDLSNDLHRRYENTVYQIHSPCITLQQALDLLTAYFHFKREHEDPTRKVLEASGA